MNYVKIIFSVLLVFSFSATASTTIKTKDATLYEGQTIVACGPVKEVKRFKRGYYLNMDDRFPRQSMTFVVWDEKVVEIQDKHGSILAFSNRNVCGTGVVTKYQGRSQIKVTSAAALQFEEK